MLGVSARSQFHTVLCRTKYVGEGSAACMFGLIMGLIILVLQNQFSADAIHQLLTFNPIDFFTCVTELQIQLSDLWSTVLALP